MQKNITRILSCLSCTVMAQSKRSLKRKHGDDNMPNNRHSQHCNIPRQERNLNYQGGEGQHHSGGSNQGGHRGGSGKNEQGSYYDSRPLGAPGNDYNSVPVKYPNAPGTNKGRLPPGANVRVWGNESGGKGDRKNKGDNKGSGRQPQASNKTDYRPSDISKGSQQNESQDSQKGSSYWEGVPFDKLKRAPQYYNEGERPIINLQASSTNKPLEWTNESSSIDTTQSVLMPYSGLEKGIDSRRWQRIKGALEKDIGNSVALEYAVRSYNPHISKLDVLHEFFEAQYWNEGMTFFTETLPKMQELALRVQELCPKPLPILKQGKNMEITLSQEQAACLLANAFFCTFPEQPVNEKDNHFSGNHKQRRGLTPSINFNTLYSSPWSARKFEKLKCIINYFLQVTENMPTGNVTYKRKNKYVNKDFWFKMNKQLTDVYVSSKGTIESVGGGMLQVDFANKFIGGGVLNNGLVQEEISFVLSPEMILSRLFTEMLTDNDVLIMTGCERFNEYEGYSDTFQFKGNYVDPTNWKYTEVVAMDALVFRDNYCGQFENGKVFRELNKAYIAFSGNESETDLSAVCTGNWGCGAFGGDTQLKALIQMMAATAANRGLCYLTFHDTDLCQRFGKVYKIFKEKKFTIKNILDLIKEYNEKLVKNPNTKEYLFDHIEQKFADRKENSKVNEKRNKKNNDQRDSYIRDKEQKSRQNSEKEYSHEKDNNNRKNNDKGISQSSDISNRRQGLDKGNSQSKDDERSRKSSEKEGSHRYDDEKISRQDSGEQDSQIMQKDKRSRMNSENEDSPSRNNDERIRQDSDENNSYRKESENKNRNRSLHSDSTNTKNEKSHLNSDKKGSHRTETGKRSRQNSNEECSSNPETEEENRKNSSKEASPITETEDESSKGASAFTETGGGSRNCDEEGPPRNKEASKKESPSKDPSRAKKKNTQKKKKKK